MTVQYTNRKGKTYVLCRGTTKVGNPHYYFAREPKGEPVDEVPEGYEIRENVNGLVYLAKVRPRQISSDELAAVEAALDQHPQARNYRVEVKGKQIVINERTGADIERLLPMLKRIGMASPERVEKAREVLDQRVRFAPVLRFTLADEVARTFYAERRYFPAGRDRWVGIGSSGPVRALARKLVPKLGTAALFDVL
jgi:hypothetical protein